jgi:hypothetical protein
MATVQIYNGDSYLEVVHTNGRFNINKSQVVTIQPFYDPISDTRDKVVLAMSGGGKPSYIFYFNEVTVPSSADLGVLVATLLGYMDDDTGTGAPPTTTPAPTTTAAP